jgi:site-specific DNA-adenine methylase
MNHRPRLLSPYPGAKNPAVYPVHDGGDYDAWVAPFAGSGEQEAWVAQRYPGLPVIAADADFLVRATWESWGKAHIRKATASLIEAWQHRIERNPEKAFTELAEFANWYYCPGHQSCYNPVLVATVSILLRRLTFGGVIRRNNDGVLDVGLNQNKLKSFLKGWQFTWPTPPKSLKVFADWSQAMDWVAGHDPRTPETNYRRAIALVDPPYCAGTTDAYANADGDYTMALDCIEGLLASGNVARIVAFNYWGEWVEGAAAPTEYPICEAMRKLAAKYDAPAHFSHLGTLTTMNKSGGRGAVHRFEGVWEIGGRRLYGNHPIVKPECESVEQMALAI